MIVQLDDGLNFLKGVCAYNMVIVHAAAFLVGRLPSGSELAKLIFDAQTFRASFSMLLPAFAGFYLRHSMGPWLGQGHRQWPSLAFISRLALGAMLIEAARQFLMYLSIDKIFTWSSLHFCSLSAVVCLIASRWGTIAVLAAAGMTMFLRIALSSFTPTFLIPLAQHPPPSLPFAVLGWGVCFGAMCAGAYKLTGRSRGTVLIGIAATLLGMCLAQTSPVAQLNLHNLPFSIFLLFPQDNNHWPFLVFFPLFVAGFFARDLGVRALSASQRVALLGVCLVLLSSAIYDLYLHQVSSPGGLVIQRSVFDLPIVVVLGLGAHFYLSWRACSWLTAYLPKQAVRMWLRWNETTLTLYVIHTGVVALTTWTMVQLDWHFASLISFQLALHGIYIVSLTLCGPVSRLVYATTARLKYNPHTKVT